MQNVSQDFIVLDFFHGWKVLKVDGRVGRDPQNRENFFLCGGGRSCRMKRCVQKINVSRAGDPVHAGDKALTRETPMQRGRVNRYVYPRSVEVPSDLLKTLQSLENNL